MMKMTAQEIAHSYDQLASHWDGEKFHRANGIVQHERAFQFLKTKTKGSAIDIGCGSSGRIIDLLMAEGFETEGLDISPEMIRLAKRRHPERLFYLADIISWNFPKRYDFISAWDSIWHAPLECHEAILRKLCDHLSDDGVLIFTSGGVDEPGEGSNPFLGHELYHAALGIPKLLEIITECGCVCRHLEYDQYPELHIYFIVQKVNAYSSL
ncbi:MAG: class I SAM-dependent DNA methyltransferase [Akkermansiaceae bacterium]